jgi:hypothetical protein
LRRSSGWLVVFEASRALGDAGAFMIAAALAGDPGAAAIMRLEEEHWNKLDAWLTRGSSSGAALLGGRFYRAKPAGSDVDWIALRSSSDSGNTLVRESFDTAEGIGELLIRTPYINAVDDNLTCRIGSTGNIRLYGAEVSDGMVECLLEELEAIWEF